VAIGLHLTLTAPFRPLSTDFAPVVDGAFPAFQDLACAAVLRWLDRARLEAEVNAQVAAFADAFGQAPEFVDGHRHVHLLPLVRDAVLAATKKLGPDAWARQCAASGAWLRFSDPKGILVHWLSRGFRRRARAAGVPTNPAFTGTYTYRPDADFPALFSRFLAATPDGGLIMCHPGRVDSELERVDPLTSLREREYDYFLSEAFRRALAEHDVALA